MRVISMTFGRHYEQLTIQEEDDLQLYNLGKLGTSFESIMNLDHRRASRIIRGYHLADGQIDSFDVIWDIIAFNRAPNPDFMPPNYKLIYQQLVELDPLFSYFYCEDDWVELIYDFYDGPIGGRMHSNFSCDIALVNEFINLIEQTPDMFSCGFLEYLNECDSLPPFPIEFPAVSNAPIQRKHHPCPADMSLSNHISSIYGDFIQDHGGLRETSYTYKHTRDSCLGFVLAASLIELSRNSKAIRKCKNCGRYFIPENRADTQYCNNISPNNASMTCKEYGSQRLWYERQKDDELATLSRNILSAKSMLAKRNKDMPEYQISYDYFRKERIKWKKDVESGIKSREEYREWLCYMQSQKRIKEALHGNNS